MAVITEYENVSEDKPDPSATKRTAGEQNGGIDPRSVTMWWRRRQKCGTSIFCH
ncbi:hypothetical protein M408DRAFT_333083 [Serendipita vermifera MAFF 305830]|uniref:Uncharacterized protein n=1 Tax=Serendipita vermifera MAFF 305830 TaxID=933852 RepID=A0A0C3ABR0_SERVB|nr:hypothetical protein M408DRAFT_333083 [Serendipita vermifera MAFF 305830]